MREPLWWVLGAVSLGCLAHLWARAGGGTAKKATWSVVLLVPALGPLFYLAMYAPPAEQEESLQAKESDGD